MDLETAVKKNKSRIENIKNIGTEAATKSALIEPLIRALGYDTSDIDEVCPEYTADFGTKKGEKIDYAILKDGIPIMLIECKIASEELKEKHEGQLHRYFTSIASNKVSCKIAVLTNGIKYRFFSDFDKPNILDKRPFFEIDIGNATQEHITVLKKFSKSDFNLTELMSEGKNMLMMRNITSILRAEMENPTEEFVKTICSKCYDRNLTPKVINEYTPLIKKSFHQMIAERVASDLTAAIEQTRKKPEMIEPEQPMEVSSESIVPTEEEIIGFNIVRAICIPLVPAERIFIRKQPTYCSVLLDDNNRKTILRMYFNRNKKFIATLDADKKEIKMQIDLVPEISLAKEQIREVVKRYIES